MAIIKRSKKYFNSKMQRAWFLFCNLILFTLTGFYTPQQEYQVKAVFLYNFSQFVNWPEKALVNNSFVIGVLGKDPMGAYLDEAVKGESVNGKSIIVRRFAKVEESYGSHILFIKESNKEELKWILSMLKGKNILTVSDTRGFTEMGGMIEFYNKENKIALRINVESAKKANLEISSKLLRLAEVVGN